MYQLKSTSITYSTRWGGGGGGGVFVILVYYIMVSLIECMLFTSVGDIMYMYISNSIGAVTSKQFQLEYYASVTVNYNISLCHCHIL